MSNESTHHFLHVGGKDIQVCFKLITVYRQLIVFFFHYNIYIKHVFQQDIIFKVVAQNSNSFIYQQYSKHAVMLLI